MGNYLFNFLKCDHKEQRRKHEELCSRQRYLFLRKVHPH